MKLQCPNNPDHKSFRREAYDSRNIRVNVELVDEYGRFFHDRLDLYTGDVTYRFLCADCGEAAIERE